MNTEIQKIGKGAAVNNFLVFSRYYSKMTSNKITLNLTARATKISDQISPRLLLRTRPLLETG
jgi:hypothetical protein